MDHHPTFVAEITLGQLQTGGVVQVNTRLVSLMGGASNFTTPPLFLIKLRLSMVLFLVSRSRRTSKAEKYWNGNIPPETKIKMEFINLWFLFSLTWYFLDNVVLSKIQIKNVTTKNKTIWFAS